MTVDPMSKTTTHERLAQKRRTRAAILSAARALVAEGQAPTVAEAADAAHVSRATAYRYFPSQEALLVEIPLDEDAPTVASLFGEDAPTDAEERTVAVQHALFDLARDHEAEFRVFLRASMTRALEDGDAKRDSLRGARRTDLLDTALAPLAGELTPDALERLKAGLSMLMGIESLVVLCDVLRLDHAEARDMGEWAVRRLVRAARAEVRA
jgi:AcrR family transcriptional regulator